MPAGEPRKTILVVCPAPGTSGVGDYAEKLFQHSLTYRYDFLYTSGGRGDTILGTLKALLQTRQRRRSVHVHCEISAGSITPFWAAVIAGRTSTATIHDPPHPVWWPFRSRVFARLPILNHLLHYPLRELMAKLQRRLLGHRRLITLSRVGREVMASCGYNAIYVPHFAFPDGPITSDPTERPRAVGIFGHNYGGKGWDKLHELREELSSDIPIIVGGSGTETLPASKGIENRGRISEEDLLEFFSSFRLLLLPYDAVGPYGPFYSASGVTARAYGYRIPILATDDRNFAEEAKLNLLRSMGGSPQDWARAIHGIIDDGPALRLMTDAQSLIASDRSVGTVRKVYEQLWL